MRNFCLLISLSFIFCCNSPSVKSEEKKKIAALIIDGQNNHGIWPKTTMMMKDFLHASELFEVDILRTNNTWQGPHSENPKGIEDITELMNLYPLGGTYEVVEKPEFDESFSVEFEKYEVIISNLGWQAAPWPEATKQAFEKYMSEGGGFVVLHAADNAWPAWKEYNKMIGVGGWSDRNTLKDGPQLYYDEDDKLQRQIEESPCGSHGPQSEFIIENRSPDHPIMKGVPKNWLHTKDELYERLCGPAENVTVLATAFSDAEGNSPPWNPEVKGSNRDEPVLMAINYGKGRVFHNVLGHADYSIECVGFMTTMIRGCEWAGTGKVSYPVPNDFPTENRVASLKYEK